MRTAIIEVTTRESTFQAAGLARSPCYVRTHSNMRAVSRRNLSIYCTLHRLLRPTASHCSWRKECELTENRFPNPSKLIGWFPCDSIKSPFSSAAIKKKNKETTPDPCVWRSDLKLYKDELCVILWLPSIGLNVVVMLINIWFLPLIDKSLILILLN